MDSLASHEGALSELPSSSSRNRERMPQIPEEQVELSQRANAPLGVVGRSSHSSIGVSPLTLNNVNNASGTRNNHCSRLQHDELKFFRDLKTISTDLDLVIAMLKKDQVPPVNTLRPFEAYVKETDELIKKLLAEIAEREMA